MYSRKLYATGTATANAVASLTIPGNSRLIGIQWAVSMDSVTDNASVILEVSAASATEIAVNASQQCLSEVRLWGNFVTSGLSAAAINTLVVVPGVPFAQGQLIYLHAVVGGTLTYYSTALLWFA